MALETNYHQSNRLSAPAGQKIELDFDNFNMASSPGCKKQGLAILDPAVSKVPGQTVILCGSTKPESFKSKGNKLFLHLSSNLRGASDGEFLVKYRIKQKGMDMSGPGGSPGNGTPMGVFGPLNEAPPTAVGGGGPKRPKKAPKKAPRANGNKQPNMKEIIAKMAAASDRTGQPKQGGGGRGIGRNKMAGGGQEGKWRKRTIKCLNIALN